jgi:hypothetical protein
MKKYIPVAVALCVAVTLSAHAQGRKSPLSKAEREALTPDKILELMIEGNDSPVLAGLERDGKIKNVGAVYDLKTGKVAFLK